MIHAAVVFSGIAAAVMSSVDSFENVGAAALTHDLPVALSRRPHQRSLLPGQRYIGICTGHQQRTEVTA